MTGSNFGPYRATALWNEAVILFRDNMPLQEHRHRLHKHRNSFTGHDAVSFLHGALQCNPLFNSDVTREQACQLLRQFLKADLISPVRNCSISNNKTAFHDSHKYLYEFTDHLIQFECLKPIYYNKYINDKKPEIREDDDALKENALNMKCNSENSWKEAIIRRIIDLLKPFDASDLFDMKEINPKWVATNANPEWSKMKWNTELPHWILSTMQKLLQYSSKAASGSVYPNFHIDAFKVISDYFKTLEHPIILECFYKLYIEIFNYFDFLNNVEKTRDPLRTKEMKMSVSQENLIYSISSPQKKNLEKDIILTNNNLPPNHCYEAAFISDDPTIRVVSQSSVDTVHLRSKTSPYVYESAETSKKSNEISFGNNRKDLFKHKKAPLKSVHNFQVNKRPIEPKSGIVNEGFAIFSPKRNLNQSSPLESTRYKSDDCLNYKSTSDQSDNPCSFGYINYGLSFSVEDMKLLANDKLDYSYALESLNRLMKVSKYNHSSSSDDYSFHTALSSSEAELSDADCYLDDSDPVISHEVNWNSQICGRAITIFQLLLMLLPPCNRAQLKNLSILIFEISRNTSLPGLSLNDMFIEVGGSILRPKVDNPYSSSIINKILSFIVNHHDEIFSDLSSELQSVITNDIFERQLKAFTFCKQISEEQFQLQKSEESSNALIQLLDQIIQNSAISDKERKKHLKVFKESYPAIYKKRFPQEYQTQKSKVFFSFKSFRL